MKPAGFDYLRVEHPEEATAALSRHGDEARILAGGQSLMAVLNMRLAQPALLIDISRSQALAGIRVVDGALEVQAAATQGQLEWRPTLAAELPLLAQALPCISHFQVRNRGTVCGSIAHADPSAELPLCLLALQGEVLLASEQGRRRVAAADFFTGMLSTARRNDELLQAVRFPLARPGQGQAFSEFANRHGDYAVCAAAAVVDAQGIRLAIGGVADRPVARHWPRFDPVRDSSALDDALNDFAWDLDARDDPAVSAALRRHLVRRLGRQVPQNPKTPRSQFNHDKMRNNN